MNKKGFEKITWMIFIIICIALGLVILAIFGKRIISPGIEKVASAFDILGK